MANPEWTEPIAWSDANERLRVLGPDSGNGLDLDEADMDAAMCGQCGGQGCWWCDHKGYLAA